MGNSSRYKGKYADEMRNALKYYSTPVPGFTPEMEERRKRIKDGIVKESKRFLGAK